MVQRTGINYSKYRILLIAIYLGIQEIHIQNIFNVKRGVEIVIELLYIINKVIEQRQKHVTNFPFSFVYFIHLLIYLHSTMHHIETE